MDPSGLEQYSTTKPEAHNGGKQHVHWGSKNNSRANAVNKDGTIRHGKDVPKKVKKEINKKYNWNLKSLLPVLLETELNMMCEGGDIQSCKLLGKKPPLCYL